jgi:hypothetical protein
VRIVNAHVHEALSSEVAMTGWCASGAPQPAAAPLLKK